MDKPTDQTDTLRADLQKKCADMDAYWRAADAHGVTLTIEQATELLAQALGVEVEITYVSADGGEDADRRQDEINELAVKLDIECWRNYTGQDKAYRQRMDARRTASLEKAAKKLRR